MGHRVWQSWQALQRWRSEAPAILATDRNEEEVAETLDLRANEAQEPRPHDDLDVARSSPLVATPPLALASEAQDADEPLETPTLTPAVPQSSTSGSLWDNVWSDSTPASPEASSQG
jgi:hypothetical protein